jgi:4'-phosphopantetheinyl transferase
MGRSMWSVSPASLSLSSGVVHVWRASLAQPTDVQESFSRTLNDDESARAARFHFEQHRRRFVLARGVLRALLARYLRIEPAEVRFAYGPYGKPSLVEEHGVSGVRFNASHSHELAVYAFAQEREIGVDVEYVKSDFAGEEIAQQFFSAHEVQTLMSLPESERAAAFFRCWTRKEAYIKAIGNGLSHPLNGFDVTVAPHEDAWLIRDHRDDHATSHWSMFNLELEGYAGALVVEGLSVAAVHKYDYPTP